MYLSHALRAILRTAVATGDALWKYVSLLLSGTPPTQTFIADASVNANVLTLNGDVRPSNLNPYVEGYYSNYFDGTGDWLTYTGGATTTLSGDFTLECWVYVTSFPTNQPIICIGDDYNLGALFYIDTAGKLGLFANNVQILLSAAAITTNNWNHVAYVRSGATTTAYINGVARGTGTSSSQWSGATTHIGREVYNTGTGILLSGYLSNLRLVKGTAVYTANFTPPTAPLTAISGTSLLTCQSNRFIDNSANNFAITRTGDVAVRGFVPFTPPTTVNVDTLYSAAINGTGDGLITPTGSGNLVTTDFTWEAWVNFSSLSSAVCLIASGNSSDRTLLYYDTSLGLRFAASRSSTDQISVQQGSTSGWSVNTWYHVAIVRNGNVYNLYRNGVSIGTSTTAYAQSDVGRGLTIGYSEWAASYLVFSGLMSNVRVVNGTAVYTANFTPPTSPLTAIANTRLLTCQGPTFVDSSPNAFALTSYGNTRPIPVSPFTQVTTALNTTFLGSGYFDGSGDYLTVPQNTAFSFGTGDFTIEAWVYHTNLGSYAGYSYGGTSGLVLRRTDTNTLEISHDGVTSIAISSGTVPSNQWVHVAGTRSGATVRLFINGVLNATSTYSGNIVPSTSGTIGSISTVAGYYMTGNISNLRIVKGTAVYTANFAPPATPLTAVANTALLTLQTDQPAANKQFVDNSGNNLVITQAGNATQGSFSPYGANWSNYFNSSTSDALTIGTSAANFLCTGSATGITATLEAWVYPTAYSTGASAWLFSPVFAKGATYINFGVRNGAVRFYWYDGAAKNVDSASTADVPLNTWTHIAATISGTTVKIYVNGVLSTTANTYTGVQTAALNTDPYIAYEGSGTLFSGYISNFRLSSSVVYASAFTPSTAPLTPSSSTQVLTCQSPSFIDNSFNPLSITRSGSASVQRFSPFSPVIQAPVSYSTYFDGSGDYLSAPDDVAFTMGSGDFTIECWINLSTLSGSQMVIGTADAPGNQGSMSFVLNVNSGTPRIGVGYGNAVYYATAASTITANTWVHLAGVRNGASVYIYVNGVQSTALNMASLAINDSTQIVAVGRNGNYNGEYVTGYISNVRIVKGTAVYTADFTPPTAPLTAITNTALLTCQSPVIVDNSSNAFALTGYGNVTAKTFNPFGSTNTTTGTAYTPALYGGSAYFDGTGDYLSTPSLISASGDFTLECWFNTTIAVSGFRMLCGGNIDASASNYLGINASGVEAQFGSGSATVVTAAYTFVPNTWYHVAMTRSGTTIRIFVNGVSLTTSQGSQAGTFAIRYIAIGYNGITFTGYMADLRFVIGQAIYTGGFVPPAAPLQAVKNTTLLLNMDKAGAADSSRSNDLETVGDAKIRYESPYSGSYYSNYFDGSGDYLSMTGSSATNFSGVDWTVETFVYVSATPVDYLYIIQSQTGANNWKPYLGIALMANGTINCAINATNYTSTQAITFNSWNHLALVRSSGVVKLYINGVASSVSVTSDINNSNLSFWFGKCDNSPGGGSYIYYLNGYMSNTRFVKGTAVYTSAFTPPTSPLTAVAGTSLLTCQSKSLVDNSSNNFTITRSGDVAVRSMNPFQANIANSSMYFDGNGDYLSVSPVGSGELGTGDFTIEYWMNASPAGSYSGPAGTQEIGGNTTAGMWRCLNRFNFANGIYFAYTTGSTFIDITFTTTNYNDNTWHHVAYVKSGTSLKAYVDGTQVGTAVTVTQSLSSGKKLTLGYNPQDNGYYTGYIADLRITKSARYTANFTPPTAPLPTA